MTFDDETLVAYADGELDPIQAKRVELAIGTDTTLADRVAAHRLLREQVSTAFPLGSGTDPLSDTIRAHTVVAMPIKKRAGPSWLKITAVAASGVALVAVGTQWKSHRNAGSSEAQIASPSLAAALETKLASTTGETRMLVSFRNRAGDYCRVFATAPISGIACKNDDTWKMVRSYSGSAQQRYSYRQAGSANNDLLKEAQNMMAGVPLDATDEQRARSNEWNPK